MLPRYLLNFDLTLLQKSYSDFLVVGSGIAGLYTALKLLPQGAITLLTKNQLTESNTEYAQRGIAMALREKTSHRGRDRKGLIGTGEKRRQDSNQRRGPGHRSAHPG